MRQLKHRLSARASECFTSFISSANTPELARLCAEDSQRAEAKVKGQRPGVDGDGCYLELPVLHSLAQPLSASEITGEGQTGGSCSGCITLSTVMHVAGVTISSQVQMTEKLKATYRRSFRDMEEPIPSLVNTRESALVHTPSWLLGNNPWQETCPSEM